ncbi:MAG TPA: hypothetical protein DCE41_33010 [Cytophagales bacterium]|nr:hypothetical protein [Cytophagales bacterium]HAA17702.1 hypothetical protein [Cytophagales bacterium]HAP57996.1 hypothetical protein [Cytophagales bacterium]
MSTENTVNTASFALKEILEGIAEGLNEAQEALREQPPYDAFGRPNTIYQLPYLDFSLKVTSEFETTETTASDSGGSPLYARRLRFKSLTPQKSGSSSSTTDVEIHSTISGRFVASMPNEGLPQTIIQVKTEIKDAFSDPVLVKLDISVGNAAGEALVGSIVELNFDEETSVTLNSGNVLPTEDYPAFDQGEIRTGADGLASATVSIKKSLYDAGNYFVITANVGNVTKSISISNN